MSGQEKIARQSQEWLITAFFTLLKKKPYGAISVKDIAAEADLSRRTFYRFFTDKSVLLSFYGQRLFGHYITLLKAANGASMTLEEVIRFFLNFIWEHRDRIQLLVTRGLFMALLPDVASHAPDLYAQFQTSWHIKGTPREIHYVLVFSLGGYWHVINDWMSQPNPEKPAVVADGLIAALAKARQ